GLPRIYADKGQLETVLVNLATNSRDAMPDGGELILSAESETVVSAGSPHPADLAPGRYVRISVTDTGFGMDAATLVRAREPFYTTKQPGAGTGLGLPMAQGFAEQSGGALTIASRPGQGATVALWLPEAMPEAASNAISGRDPGGKAQPATGRAARILLVDDEPMIPGRADRASGRRRLHGVGRRERPAGACRHGRGGSDRCPPDRPVDAGHGRDRGDPRCAETL